MSSARVPIVILGAGPAGLGAAFKLARRDAFSVTVLERHAVVGGNAASFNLAGLPVDFGSHRLHPTCAPEILADVQSLLGADLLDRPRHGRIRLRSRWVHFPLQPLDLLLNLPPSFILGALRDTALKAAGRNPPGGGTFASVLERGLGRTICHDFYFPYAEKIWGLPPTELAVEQARRRVSAGSPTKLMRKVLGKLPGLRTRHTGRFFYPRGGFGQISDAYDRAARARGVEVVLETSVVSVETSHGGSCSVVASTRGRERRWPASLVLSTIPLTQLARLVAPQAPPEVLAGIESLRFRSMLLIYLVLDTNRFTEFDAHYFPEAAIPVSRISEPKNYGLAEAPGRTVLCAELPCSADDPAWQMSDDALGALVVAGLETAGLPVRVPVRQVVTRRLREAYPIYTRGYERAFAAVDGWLSNIHGLVSLGRQGLFVHDNTHHTLAMAYAAASCVGDDGGFDIEAWRGHRDAFSAHVVED